MSKHIHGESRSSHFLLRHRMIELSDRIIERLEPRRLLSVTMTTLANFNAPDELHAPDPVGDVAVDSSGVVFGTTVHEGDSANDGAVFEISPGNHTAINFPQGDGSNFGSGVTLDSAGDLFGTTSEGGANGDGTIFEIAHGSSSIHHTGQLQRSQLQRSQWVWWRRRESSTQPETCLARPGAATTATELSSNSCTAAARSPPWPTSMQSTD